MQRIPNVKVHSIGLRPDERLNLPSVNHFKEASLSKTAAAAIQAKGLHRVAGNIYVSRSTKDFWRADGGKIVRITKTEVDNGESIPGAPADNPARFLDDIVRDLTF
jgi:hypothetical protein